MELVEKKKIEFGGNFVKETIVIAIAISILAIETVREKNLNLWR